MDSTAPLLRLRQLALAGTAAAGTLAIASGVAGMRDLSQWNGVFADIGPGGIVYSSAVLLVALLVVATTALGWRTRAVQPQAARLALLTGALLVAHIALSVAAARAGFPALTAVVRLSTALALVGVLLTIALARPAEAGRPVKAAQQRFRRSLLTTGGLFYVVMLVGGLVTSSGATSACGRDFPFCNGTLLPSNLISLEGLQQFHRISVLVVAVLLGTLLWGIVRSRWQHNGVRALSMSLAGSFVGQVITGAAFVLMSSTTGLAVLHQTFGTTAWASVVALALVAWHVPAEAREAVKPAWKQTVDDYIKLTKPGVISLLLLTTLATMYIAGTPSLWLVFWTMLGGYLSAGGANAINCYIDRDVDVLMGRTARRPIPSNRINPVHGLIFGIILGTLSFVLMALFVNLLSAALSLFALLFYVLVYTSWLKRSSMQNIVIGGAAGAIPPMIGWAAMTGELSLLSLFLFLIIFYWTPPHFWALALIRRDDYARAGIPMLPVVQGDSETKKQILLYSLLMIAITVLPTPLQLLGPIYLIGALLLGGIHMRYVFQLMGETANGSAWKLYRFSLLYLALLFGVMVLDAVVMRSIG